MATKDAEPAAVTIPADYLEDMRTAVIAEITSVSAWVETGQKSVLDDGSTTVSREDRAGAVRDLREDMGLLDQILEASGDTKVSGDVSTLSHALQAVVREFNSRLVDVCGYGPLPMGDVIELSARLRWAADEAIRIDPDLAGDATRKAA